MNFLDKSETKKGLIGERIVKKILKSKGWIEYKPAEEGPHPIDSVYFKFSQKQQGDCNEIMVVDYKCKELRRLYPDTGYPLKSHKKYIEIDKKIRAMVLFVDYIKGEVYGDNIRNLIKFQDGYPKIEKGIIYFPYKRMKVIKKLTKDEIEEIKEASKYIERRYV